MFYMVPQRTLFELSPRCAAFFYLFSLLPVSSLFTLVHLITSQVNYLFSKFFLAFAFERTQTNKMIKSTYLERQINKIYDAFIIRGGCVILFDSCTCLFLFDLQEECIAYL